MNTTFSTNLYASYELESLYLEENRSICRVMNKSGK